MQQHSIALIDAANLTAAVNILKLDLDFERLRDFLARHRPQDDFVRVVYFNAYLAEEDGTVTAYKFYEWLARHGYKMIHKEAKRYTQPDGKTIIKANVDVDLAVYAMRMLACGIKVFYLLSGDGDFVPLVNAIQNEGGRVVVLSTTAKSFGGHSHCATALQIVADEFIELDNMRDELVKPVKAA